MFRHLINFGLLFSFTTLAWTGLASFVFPFSIVTARLHIIFGLTTTIFVVLHLATRTRYFITILSKHKSRSQAFQIWSMLGLLFLGWVGLFALAYANVSPIPEIISQGYESRHRSEIFRVDNNTVVLERPTRIQALHTTDQKPQGVIEFEVLLNEDVIQDQGPLAIAIWAESLTGSLIETFYLSESISYSDFPQWAGQKVPRHHILPIWRHRYTLVNGLEPVDDPEQKVDAYSGATENHSFSIDKQLISSSSDFNIYIEVNLSGDPNLDYPEPMIGQPSLIYAADIRADQNGWALLELIGHSDGATEDGEIRYDLDAITTARQIIDRVLVKVTRPFDDHEFSVPDHTVPVAD